MLTRTAREYGLNILHENLADYPNNQTRFLVCGLTDNVPTGSDRTLLAVRFGENSRASSMKSLGISRSMDRLDLCPVPAVQSAASGVCAAV